MSTGLAQQNASELKRAVFLDRDGVINEGIVREGKPYPPQSVEGLRLLAGVERAVGALKDHGYTLVVVTNQPDVRTGAQRREAVEEMHRKLMEWLPLDSIKACYHTDEDGCSCRKPKPGMINEVLKSWRSTPKPASWWGTAGATSAPAMRRAACRSTSITVTTNAGRTATTLPSRTFRKRLKSFWTGNHNGSADSDSVRTIGRRFLV